MSRFVFVVIFLLIGSLISSAQEKPLPPRTLRILPVGDTPPFRQEIRDGIRHELPPPEGSVPPLRVEINAVNQEGLEEKSKYEIANEKEPGLRLRLNDISTRLTLPSGELTVRLQEKGSVWHQFTLPEEGDFLLVLWRDPKVGNWSKARSRLVRDGGQSFRAGDLRFINVGPVATGIVIGEQERFELGAGKVLVKSLGVSPGTPSEVAYRDPKKGWRRLWSSALVQNRGERSTVVVYRADGEKPRRPLKLITMRERAVALKKPSPKAATNP